MRSKKEIEEELGFLKGCLERLKKADVTNPRKIQRYKEKIHLLRWVLGEVGEDVEVRHE